MTLNVHLTVRLLLKIIIFVPNVAFIVPTFVPNVKIILNNLQCHLLMKIYRVSMFKLKRITEFFPEVEKNRIIVIYKFSLDVIFPKRVCTR